MFSGATGALSWEAGLRWETTDSDITYRGDRDDPAQTVSQDYDVLLPSAHLKWNLTDASRINASVARSLRRPDFNDIIPALLPEEFGDNDFLGNPLLEPETANGLDPGFEQQLGERGVAGINFFYRDVSNVIELVSTGVPNETAYDDWADDVEDYMDDNGVDQGHRRGRGAVRPGQLHLHHGQRRRRRGLGRGAGPVRATDRVRPAQHRRVRQLLVAGQRNRGLHRHAPLQQPRRDTSTTSASSRTSRTWPPPSAPATASRATPSPGSRGEEVLTTYDADLEVFVEKRFGDSFSVRLSGANLLDAISASTSASSTTRPTIRSTATSTSTRKSRSGPARATSW